MSDVTRICFVCLGNIVRSPLAKNLFLHLAKQAGVSQKYEVDSAGTSDWHIGEPPDLRMRRVAARHGLNYDGRARQFKAEDFDRYDLIFVMDQDNRDDLYRLNPSPEQKRKIYFLRQFDPERGAEMDVPDPYYSGMVDFEQVYEIVERSLRGLLDTLERRGLPDDLGEDRPDVENG